MLSPGGRIREAECRVLDLSVGRGEATTVLSKVFLPRWDAEDLDETVRSIPVPVQRPAGSTGSTSGLAQVVHRLEERRLPLWRDEELDGHEDGSGVGQRVEGQPPSGQ